MEAFLDLNQHGQLNQVGGLPFRVMEKKINKNKR